MAAIKFKNFRPPSSQNVYYKLKSRLKYIYSNLASLKITLPLLPSLVIIRVIES